MKQEWNEVETLDDFDQILDHSTYKPQIIFKHSTRCPISSNAFMEVSSVTEAVSQGTDINYVDVIRHRDISQEIASKLDIRHESPQLLLINNNEVVWNVTHYDIVGEDIVEKIQILSGKSTA